MVYALRRGLRLVEGCLRSPVETSQIGIFSLGGGASRAFLGLAQRSLRFLFLAIHLQRFFPFAFRECGFACSSDGVLLGEKKSDGLRRTFQQT